jgi:hypothetical protein
MNMRQKYRAILSQSQIDECLYRCMFKKLKGFFIEGMGGFNEPQGSRF